MIGDCLGWCAAALRAPALRFQGSLVPFPKYSRTVGSHGQNGVECTWKTQPSCFFSSYSFSRLPPKPPGQSAGSRRTHRDPFTCLCMKSAWKLGTRGSFSPCTIRVGHWTRGSRCRQMLPERHGDCFPVTLLGVGRSRARASGAPPPRPPPLASVSTRPAWMSRGLSAFQL